VFIGQGHRSDFTNRVRVITNVAVVVVLIWRMTLTKTVSGTLILFDHKFAELDSRNVL